MIKNRFFLLFITLSLFCGINKAKAQISPSVAIALNEYCVGNFAISDNFGYTSDWLEIYNAHTASVTLNGYYLSNDRANLYKWKFPSTFTLPINGFGIVYLSGRDVTKQVGNNWYHHASFNVDQCKNQWLILTTPQGVIRDSIFVQKTQAGHSRGRAQDYSTIGVGAWKLFPIPSFSLGNPSSGYYTDYATIPTMTPAAGWGHNGESLDFFLGGNLLNPYYSDDTLNCFQIAYTTDGSVPCLGCTSTQLYTSFSALTILDNQMFRAITFPKTPGQLLPTTYSYSPMLCIPQVTTYLPSFIETNTYFSESNGSFDNIDPKFGVMSIAVNIPDTNWFNSVGANPGPQVHVEYFENKKQVVEGYAQLYHPINEQWVTKQRGFYVTIDDRRGFGCNFEGPIFNNPTLGVSSRTVFPTLHVYAGDIESHSNKSFGAGGVSYGTGIRDVFIQSLAAKNNLKVSPLHIKPLITFVNGNYLGAYDLREVYDKYFEGYNSGQPKDSLMLQSYHNGDAFVQNQLDGRFSDPVSVGLPNNIYRTEVYNAAINVPIINPTNYNNLMNKLDKESFIDYMILNSYVMNSDIWNYNVAFGRGTSLSKPNHKWHYYLWNTPATYTFQAINTNSLIYSSPYTNPCAEYTTSCVNCVSAFGGNSEGLVMRRLMDPIQGNPSFQLDYKNRYQDLLNGPLRCDNVLSHFDAVTALFRKEMKYHEDISSIPTGSFALPNIDAWDTNIVHLRKIVEKRCDYMRLAFSTINSCYGMLGPWPISVDVYPAGAGTVKLNTVVLPNYVWNGQYFSTQLSFKAASTNTNYVFHHWEFVSHVTKNAAPLSLDSVAIDFNQAETVRAVFTDVTADIVNGDIAIPTGFSPNGDGNNDDFKPLGAAAYAHDYDFKVFNRWGQEVFRTTEPAKGWTGFDPDGKQSQTGVYAYLISYKNVYNESKIKKGNVTLVR